MTCSSASLQRRPGWRTITSAPPSRAERCRPQSGSCCPGNSPNTPFQREPRPSPNTPAPNDHLRAAQNKCKGHVCNHYSILINAHRKLGVTGIRYSGLESNLFAQVYLREQKNTALRDRMVSDYTHLYNVYHTTKQWKQLIFAD